MEFQFQKTIRFNLDVDFQKIQDMVIKDISETVFPYLKKLFHA